jgi:acyl-CoA dehydrogenase
MRLCASESERDKRRLAQIEGLGREVARPAAQDVDAAARFPRESLEALRAVGALGAAVPQALGGAGASLPSLARDCAALGRHCASSATVLATHHGQVLALARHRAGSRELGAYLSRVASEQRLIAPAIAEAETSESAVLEPRDPGFALQKHVAALPYGAHADDLLLSARPHAQAAREDQRLVLALRGSFELSQHGSWDTLGMRGTCSASAMIRAWGERFQIVAEPFAEIASATWVPASHVLWGAAWLGIATDAVHVAQASAREHTSALHGVAEMRVKLQLWRSELFAFAEEHEALVLGGERERLLSARVSHRAHGLMLASTRLVVEIVDAAIGSCGADSYRNDSPHGLGRHLRDAHSAALIAYPFRGLPSGALAQAQEAC